MSGLWKGAKVRSWRKADVRTVQQIAESAMASVGWELSDHVGDAEVLAALVDADLHRGAVVTLPLGQVP
jgi:hypothetical protein